MAHLYIKILIFISLTFNLTVFSQITVIHDIPWHSDTVGIWGSGSTAWSINRVDTLANFSVGPYNDNYSFVYQIPFPISDSVGLIFDYGAFADMQLIFEMSGWDGGAAKINYPTKIKMDFPPNNSFTNGSWATIPSEYREQDTLIHPSDNDNWDIYTDWPNAGKIELYLNMEMHANADLIYSDPSDPFDIEWDTIHIFEPINIDLDTFDIFLVDVVNNEYVIPWVAYHTDPFTGSTVIDSVFLLQDSVGWPLQFPSIFYDLIGISGDISIPNIQNYTKWIENEQRLYAHGSDEYMHINLDVIKFIEVITHYLANIPSMQGLEAVNQALQYEEGDTSIYVFTDPISNEDFTANLSWDLIDAELLFTNTMNHTLSFEDNQEYSFFGIPIGAEHYPNVWNVFNLPIAVDYNILDTLGAIIETGTSDSIKFGADYDLQLRLPCIEIDTLPITITHTIDPWLTNMVKDSVDVDFYIKVLDIAYSIGTPSNPVFAGNFLLYEDTLTLGTFAGPPLFGPPIFMPWQIDGFFIDTTFVPNIDIIPENDPLGDSIIFADVICFGTSSGSATAIGTGGVPAYTFQWADESGTIISNNSTISNLISGTYYLTITDANECEILDSVSISNINTEIIISQNITNVLCFGDSTGSVSLNVSGGVPQYQYNWNPNIGNSANCSNLSAGTYYVTITDNVNCTAFDTVTIINLFPSIDITNIQIINTTCFDGNDGSIEIDVAGGVPQYSFYWSNNMHTQNIYNLHSGTYTLTVIDNNDCSTTQEFIVTEPDELDILSTASPNAVCPGFSSVLTASGALTYEWTPTTGLSSSTGSSVTATPSTTTTYTVTGYDAIGCSSTSEVVVTIYALPTITIQGLEYMCDGQTTTLTATGGVSYVWDTGETTNSINISPIINTTYMVTGTDTNSCTNTAQHTVNVIQMPNANAGADDSICQLSYDLHAIPSIGNGSWTVVSGGSVNFNPSINSPTANITVNYTNNYRLIWTEDNGHGCVDSDTVNILLTQIPTSDFAISLIPCFGDIATITYSGTGNQYCTYYWDWNNANVSTGIGIGPHIASWDSSGVQMITLSVSLNNCMSEQSIESVLNPTKLTSSITHTNVICYGQQNGSAETIANGGTPPYNFSWNNGSTESIITGLYPGLYQVTITDFNNCRIINETNIIQPNEFIITTTPLQNICYGSPATVTISGTGGTEPYSFYWNGNLSNNEITVNTDTNTTLIASAIDNNGCVSNIEHSTIIIFSEVSLSLLQETNEICLGNYIIITPTIENGLEPYILTDEFGNELTNPINLYPTQTGWYNIFVHDICKNTDSSSVFATVHPLPNINVTADINSGCTPLTVNFNDNNYENGQMYFWDFGDNSAFSGLINPEHTYLYPGKYDVIVKATSIYNCENTINYSDYIFVWENPIADFTFLPDNPTYVEPLVLFKNTSVNGSSYSWDFGDGTSSIIPAPTHNYPNGGTYTVQLITSTDKECKDSIQKTIKIENGFTFYAPTAFSPDNNLTNNDFFILGKGIINDGFVLQVFNRWGEIIWQTNIFDEYNQQSEKWNGKAKNNKIVAVGVYKWVSKFKDYNGVYHEKSGDITVVK